MRIIPVLDVKGGIVVRGVGGRRHEYQPIVSRLTRSVQPGAVAQALRDHFGFEELYLADLDAIGGGSANVALLDELASLGFRVWADIGVRRLRLSDPPRNLVLGLETIAGPALIAEACRHAADRVAFSLDLKAGQPLGDVSAWKHPHPEAIAHQAIALGVRRLLVLDLADVGEAKGCGTVALCERIKHAHPNLELWAGGGVRDETDLDRLRSVGVDAVLIASALHDGRFSSGWIS